MCASEGRAGQKFAYVSQACVKRKTFRVGGVKSWAKVPFVSSVRTEPVEKKQRRELLYFTDDDLPRGEGHSVSLVIEMDIEGTNVKRVLVDTSSNVNILYKEVFDKLGIDKMRLKLARMPFASFRGVQSLFKFRLID